MKEYEIKEHKLTKQDLIEKLEASNLIDSDEDSLAALQQIKTLTKDVPSDHIIRLRHERYGSGEERSFIIFNNHAIVVRK